MLWLLRHPPVAVTWRARCYGVTDVPLARAAFALPEPPPVEQVVHSGLRRTRGPAEKLAAALGVPRIEDAQWRERDFGTWEGQSWHAIYRATGDAMDGMLTDPEGFRPGGDGETTMELAWRVVGAARALTRPTLVVTHGGPIAALLGLRDGLPVSEWPKHVPPYGTMVAV